MCKLGVSDTFERRRLPIDISGGDDDILLDVDLAIGIKVLVEGPVAELGKEDVSSAVGVDLLEGGIGVVNLDTPLLDGGDGLLELDGGDAAVVAGIDLVGGDPHLEEVVDVAKEEAELGALDEVDVVVLVSVTASDGLSLGVGTHEDGGKVVGEAVEGEDLAGTLVNLGEGEVTVTVGVELVKEGLAGGSILGGPAAGELHAQLSPGGGEVTLLLGAEVKTSAALLVGGGGFAAGSTTHVD